MNTQNYVGIALEELYRIFEMLNKKYFEGQLSYPMITIQAGKKSSLAGWFTLDKMWAAKDKEKSEDKYEINICAERLNASVEDIVETLQHEIVHYVNKLADIVDFHGKMHTKKFKVQAEKIGLVCHKDSKLGYALTERSPELTSFIQNIIKPNAENFAYFRIFTLKKKAAERQKKSFKYTCEECKVEAKAKRDTRLICGQCNNEMVIEED